MKRRGPALLALATALAACADPKNGSGTGAGAESGATGSGGVATGGTHGISESGGGAATGAVPTGGSRTASSEGGASVAAGGAPSAGVEPSGGVGASPSGPGGGTTGVSQSEGGAAAANGAGSDGHGGVVPSSGGGPVSTGGSTAGGSPSRGTAGTGGVSNHEAGGVAGSTDVIASSGGSGGDPAGGSSGASDDAQGGSSGGAQGGASGSAQAGAAGEGPRGLSWPIECLPQETCFSLGAPDIDGDGVAFDCSSPGYAGHQGTDIAITWEQMDAGVAVRAAADGEVFFAADGKYDRCPNATEPDCQPPAQDLPGGRAGTNVCTEYGPYCGTGTGSCFWCFAGGNVVVILHEGVSGVFATRYDHLRKGSVLVRPGDRVVRGQVIAEVGSAGASTQPHLHFEVWGTGYYELADPWAGPCGPNLGPSLWANEPPWD
jgi:murein DD-endopeptidase MepM/ murein hydrolase activator NlpD